MKKTVEAKTETTRWTRGRSRVQVSGLKEGSAFKQSIAEECERALARYEKKLGEVQIAVHVRANPRGGRKLFELQGTLFLPRRQFFSKASDADVFTALAHLIEGFDEEVQRAQSFKQEKYVPRRLKKKARLWRK